MCGVAGEISFNNSQCVYYENIKKMVAKIIHRGPEDQGVYISEDRKIGLGASRLSFLDFSNSRQPLQDATNNAVICFNGEVYEAGFSKKQLEQKGYEFKSYSDTELVLINYLHSGVSSFSTLNGEFTFAIYDKIQDLIVIVTDRFGIKPLYYTIINGILIFASEIKSILTRPYIKKELNERTIFEQFYRADSLERTMIKGIKLLKPGHYIIVKKGNIYINKYWDINLPTISNELKDKNTVDFYKEKLEHAIIESIKKRVVSDSEIGAFLSGGIDSSLLTSIYQKISNKQVKTFSIKFSNTVYDESYYSRLVSRHIDSNHYELEVSDKDLVNIFPKAIYHCEHFTQQIDGGAKLLLSKFASKFVKGVIVGEGADELFLGYPWFKLINYYGNKNATDFISVAETARKGTDLTEYYHTNGIDEYIKKYTYFPISINNILTMKEIFGKSIFSDAFLHTINYLNFEPEDIYYEDIGISSLYKCSNIRKAQFEFIKRTLPTYIFKFLGDKMEMANSLESRLPYFDNGIIDLVSNIPSKFLLNKFNEKYILKLISKDYIPVEITKRVKHGYSSSMLDGYLANNSPSYFNYLLSDGMIKKSGIFNNKKVNNLLKYCKKNFGRLDQNFTLYERALIFILSVQISYVLFIEEDLSILSN